MLLLSRAATTAMKLLSESEPSSTSTSNKRSQEELWELFIVFVIIVIVMVVLVALVLEVDRCITNRVRGLRACEFLCRFKEGCQRCRGKQNVEDEDYQALHAMRKTEQRRASAVEQSRTATARRSSRVGSATPRGDDVATAPVPTVPCDPHDLASADTVTAEPKDDSFVPPQPVTAETTSEEQPSSPVIAVIPPEQADGRGIYVPDPEPTAEELAAVEAKQQEEAIAAAAEQEALMAKQAEQEASDDVSTMEAERMQEDTIAAMMEDDEADEAAEQALIQAAHDRKKLAALHEAEVAATAAKAADTVDAAGNADSVNADDVAVQLPPAVDPPPPVEEEQDEDEDEDEHTLI